MNNCAQIAQGTTYIQLYGWGGDPIVYKAVSALVRLIPLTLTVPGHGVPDGYSVAFTNFMSGLTADEWPPDDDDFYQATAVDADTLAFNSVDGSRFGTYATGGIVAYYTPLSLIGATGTITVKLDGVIVLSTPLALNDATKRITATLTPAQTAALAVGNYTYFVEVVDSGAAVTMLDEGAFTIFTPGDE
jgi:hypothetical protein